MAALVAVLSGAVVSPLQQRHGISPALAAMTFAVIAVAGLGRMVSLVAAQKRARRERPVRASRQEAMSSMGRRALAAMRPDGLAAEATRLHDPLTGLPTYELLRDRLDQALARTGRNGSSVGLMFIDLDGFKAVNDSLGHRAGDQMLVDMSGRVSAVLRSEDTLARFAGDEFVVVCEDVDEHAVVQLAERIGTEIARPLPLDDTTVSVRASVGIVMATDGPANVEDLLRDADAAMYRAKRLGGGRFELHDEMLRERHARRQQVRRDLERADRDELQLAYQPLVALGNASIASTTPSVAGLRVPAWDVVVGVEALLRWRHPARGWVRAADFLPVAESSGLILPIGAWTLHQACRQLARWYALAPDDQPFTVFVNLSQRELADELLVGGLVRSLEETGADPRGLGVEVTERVLRADDEEAFATLEMLSALGVRLAIDDFGSGLATHADLQRLPVEYVKIDAAHINGSIDRALVSSVTGMARELGIAVVAEGVETPEQLEVVRSLGCQLAQGFHLGRPTGAEDIDDLLGAGRGVRQEGV